MSSKRNRYLTDEPSVTLGIPGDPFTLFYDYDQIRDRKLSTLCSGYKVVWLRARLEMTFLEPLRRLWDRSSAVFKELMFTSPHQQNNCSFSIAAMAVMLNGIEALGAFLRPDLNGRNKNKQRFQAFLSQYMKEWAVKVPVSGRPVDVVDPLWANFRNGIAHGFCIKEPGSLEFLETLRFEPDGQVLRVCPRHFFADLERGVAAYFAFLKNDPGALQKFDTHFNSVYPS